MEEKIKEAEKLQRDILNIKDFHELGIAKQKLDEICLYIKHIQSVVMKLANVYTASVNHFKVSFDILKQPISSNTLPDKEAEYIPEKNAELAPGIKINAEIIKNSAMLPNYPLFYLEETAQFAIKINNVVYAGNIGNILTKQDAKTKVYKCYKDNCSCPKYHHKKGEIRNYLNSSFLYHTGTDLSLTRHIGNRDRLKKEIEDYNIVKSEIELRSDQTMHDILIMQAIKSVMET